MTTLWQRYDINVVKTLPHGFPTTIINYYYYLKPNNGYKHVQSKRNNLTLLMKFVANFVKENHLAHGLIYINNEFTNEHMLTILHFQKT